MSAAARPQRHPAATAEPGFAVEPTAIGLQAPGPGSMPITTAARAAAARHRNSQRPCDLGLFDLDARNRLDLFQPPAALRRRGASPEPRRCVAKER